MMKQLSAFRDQLSEKMRHASRFSLEAESRQLKAGFTLVETLVAVSLLTIAVVVPISLTAQALQSAYYARDQITAYYLAQEGIEVVRWVRDGNVLKVALGQSANLLDGIPSTAGKPFTVDTLAPAGSAMSLCPTSDPASCPPLKTNGTAYGYTAGWQNSIYTRSVEATVVSSVGGVLEEVRVSVTVSWKAGNIPRSFTLSENLYRWVQDGAAS